MQKNKLNLRICGIHLLNPYKNVVSHLNTVIDNACVPAEWKLAEICPIFKRDDQFDKSKYRPVSILVLLDKVFERCVQKQLVHYFNPHLSKFLSAYRLSLIHISEPTRPERISYAVFCLKKTK